MKKYQFFSVKPISNHHGLQFGELPFDIVLYVFNTLNVKELANASLVSKEWNEKTNAYCLWKKFGAQSKQHYVWQHKTGIPVNFAKAIVNEGREKPFNVLIFGNEESCKNDILKFELEQTNADYVISRPSSKINFKIYKTQPQFLKPSIQFLPVKDLPIEILLACPIQKTQISKFRTIALQFNVKVLLFVVPKGSSHYGLQNVIEWDKKDTLKSFADKLLAKIRIIANVKLDEEHLKPIKRMF